MCEAYNPDEGTPSEVCVSTLDDFEVRVLAAEGEAVIQVVGEIDLSAKHLLLEALNGPAADSRRLVIDLSHTSFIDSTGLKALLEVWRSRQEAGTDFVVRRPSPAVMRTLETAGLANVLPIESSDGS